MEATILKLAKPLCKGPKIAEVDSHYTLPADLYHWKNFCQIGFVVFICSKREALAPNHACVG